MRWTRDAPKCLVRTVDTDVVAILIGKYHSLTSQHQMAAIWVAFGTGKNFMYRDINAICHALGKDRSTALPMFHSFTGCDTTSPFFGKGEKISMGGLECLRGGDGGPFNNFMNHPFHDCDSESKQFQLLERFTVIIYNKTSNLDSVNEARREKSSHRRKRPMEKIPPKARKPFCSTHCAQSTKLESGQPVIKGAEAPNPRGLLDGL
ncbi:hypothetical protein GWK47_003122 [Chionoecetes opilio]|uniref:Uncharacterized protein n=1 Tax=Chionoecetes opilio TaxID=41210 RepID=A0A8J8WMT6_CHIOP|nr:hypothetical protein GWK47_003122 [Chionoecetes opilio]